MLDKIKDYISTFAADAKAKLNNMQKPIQWIVIGYFILVLLLVLTYYIAWLYLWQGGKAALPDLLAIIKEMIGPAMIGFVTFIGGCFVDLNNNGVPDRLENDKQGGRHR
mgnify:CR=1 FL=1